MTVADDLRIAAEMIEDEWGKLETELTARLRQHADTIERVIDGLDDVAYSINTSLLDSYTNALRGDKP